MCWVEKCCFLVPLDVGCLILGLITFLLSLASVIFSTILLCIEETDAAEGLKYFFTITHLNLNESSIKIILSFIITVEVIWIVFSALLIIGICKNKSNFVLGYFGFGIMMVILWSLNGLLLLLKYHWIMAMIVFILVCVYTHCLLAVHLTYEQMLNGKLKRFISDHDPDQTMLVDSESDLAESDMRV